MHSKRAQGQSNHPNHSSIDNPKLAYLKHGVPPKVVGAARRHDLPVRPAVEDEHLLARPGTEGEGALPHCFVVGDGGCLVGW